VVFLYVKGSWIKKKLAPHLKNPEGGLWIVGLHKKGKLYYVNNRVLEEAQHYRVATTRFVAKGGDQLIVDPKLKYHYYLKDRPSLRNVVAEFFEDEKHRRTKSFVIDLKKNFMPLNKKFLLSATVDLNLAFNDVSIWRPGRYTDQPQLSRQRVLGLLFSGTVVGKAVNHLHTLSATLTMKYGKTRTWVADDQTNIEAKTTSETDDLISLYLLYKFTRFHSKYMPSKWYFPIPFFETYGETEFTRDLRGKDGKEYRYTEVAGILGPGFMPYPKIFLKLGFVVRSYKLSIPDERESDLGFYAGATVERMSLFKISKAPVYYESRLDFYLTDFGDNLFKELIWTNKLSFTLIDRIFLNFTHEFYVYDTAFDKANVASNTVIGIQIVTDYRLQTF
jgi:hypothetical protein